MENYQAGHSNNSHEDHGHGDSEPTVIKKLEANQMLAQALTERGIISEPIPVGSHPLESKPYYSHKFTFTSRFTTNRGVIKVTGKNFDMIHVIQRS